MNNLEKKFYKYLNRQCVADDFKHRELRKQMARELSAIAISEVAISEQKYLDREAVENICAEHLFFDKEHGSPEEFVTDICNLAIPEPKYLDREKVRQIFLLWQSRGYLREDTYIEAICNLAIPITRDKIIKVLKANRDSYVINDDMKIKDPIILEENFEKIATEILEGKEGEDEGRLPALKYDINCPLCNKNLSAGGSREYWVQIEKEHREKHL